MPKSDPPGKPSVSTQLVIAIVVALGIGGGGGSIIAADHATPESLELLVDERTKAAEAVYATKLELAALSAEIQLVQQALATVNGSLQAMGAQLTTIEESVRDNHHRRR